jgi:hypothetical protein
VSHKQTPLYLAVLGVCGFLQTGCYTQLAVTRDPAPVVVQNQTVADSVDTVYVVQETTPSLVHEYHYWFIDPRLRRFGYPPYYTGADYYLSVHFGWYDPFWDPWYDPWYGYSSGWAWCDPYWWYGWDPYYWGYAYSPYYYYGYRPPWWYQPSYVIYDPLPRKKRDWERRGAEWAEEPILRPAPGGDQPSQSSFTGEQTRVVPRSPSESPARVIVRPDRSPARETVRRQQREIRRPSRERGSSPPKVKRPSRKRTTYLGELIHYALVTAGGAKHASPAVRSRSTPREAGVSRRTERSRPSMGRAPTVRSHDRGKSSSNSRSRSKSRSTHRDRRP